MTVNGSRFFWWLRLVTWGVTGVGHSMGTAEEQELVSFRVTIVDECGRLLPARAWVEAGERRFFERVRPESCTPYARDRSFSCDGRFEMEVPAGKMVVHVEHRKEYLPVEASLDLQAGAAAEVSVRLCRWIDMPTEGWYSSDMHVHFGSDDARVLRQLAFADDVHVIPAFTYWLRGTEAQWPERWPAWGGSGEEPIDAQHLITRNNLEIERPH
jgi:hypothetical protein